MVQDAKAHESEDKQKRRQVDARNQADATLFQSEKRLAEFGDRLSSDVRSRIETANGRLKEALKGDNTDEMTSAAEALNQVWQQASAEMYQQASQTTGAQGQPSPDDGGRPSGSDEAVDADFEEVK